MNTRCYRCGRSFTIGREEVEAAAVASAGQKFHVVYCPNCRTAIKMPMEQVTRELPPGWQPPAPAADGAAEAAAKSPSAEAVTTTEPGQEIEAVVVGVHKSHRRHRHAKSADEPVEVAPVEPIFLAEPPAPETVPEPPVAERKLPAPKRAKPSAAKKTAPAVAKPAKPAASAKQPAAAAKKTARITAAAKKK